VTASIELAATKAIVRTREPGIRTDLTYIPTVIAVTVIRAWPGNACGFLKTT
jgi:hypothetical protein